MQIWTDEDSQTQLTKPYICMSEVLTNLVSNNFNHQFLLWLNFLPYMYLDDGYLNQLVSNGRF